MNKQEQIDMLKETIELCQTDLYFFNDKGFSTLAEVRTSQLERYEGKLNELIR